MVAAHNGTHMDALCHVYADEQMYNGHSSQEFTSHNGAPHCGIEKIGWLRRTRRAPRRRRPPGRRLAGAGHEHHRRRPRGLPGGSRRRARGRATSCSCAPAGSICSRRSQGAEPPFMQPGLGASTIDYIADLDLAAVGCDNAAVEVIPFDGAVPRAAHRVAGEAGRDVPRAPRAVAARGRRREGVPARGGAAARHRRHRQPDQPDRDRLVTGGHDGRRAERQEGHHDLPRRATPKRSWRAAS